MVAQVEKRSSALPSAGMCSSSAGEVAGARAEEKKQVRAGTGSKGVCGRNPGVVREYVYNQCAPQAARAKMNNKMDREKESFPYACLKFSYRQRCLFSRVLFIFFCIGLCPKIFTKV